MFLRFAEKIRGIDAKLDRLLARIENPVRNYVSVNQTHFRVAPHWFWDEFVRERWEPYTYEVMREYLTPESRYVDIGTWVGPTILYAAELGVRDIFGVEANPLTYRLLLETIAFNSNLSGVRLTNVCITDQDHEFVPFGGKTGEDTSSASSIRGSNWTVRTTTLLTYLRANNLENCDFIKIDIEGAEALMTHDLATLGKRSGLIILLSLHPPMWDEVAKTGEQLIESLQGYSIALTNGDPLPVNKLRDRIITRETYPSWGTRFGNFFEIILKAR